MSYAEQRPLLLLKNDSRQRKNKEFFSKEFWRKIYETILWGDFIQKQEFVSSMKEFSKKNNEGISWGKFPEGKI